MLREDNYGKVHSIQKEACAGTPAVVDFYDLNFQIHFLGTLTLCGCAALHSWLDVGASSHLSVIIIIPGNSAVWVPQAS